MYKCSVVYIMVCEWVCVFSCVYDIVVLSMWIGDRACMAVCSHAGMCVCYIYMYIWIYMATYVYMTI